MRIIILILCTFGVSAQMSLLNKIDPHSMVPGKQFGNQYGPNDSIDDDVRLKIFANGVLHFERI